ncbi:SPFH domain-containing protein [Gordonia sp. N1V]|uniref:SPFH domain-containing protein n=1 Tax=Gordonia sp. N1V TaxID=3034163 RepID=UPI0023E34275|nr:SPFH domain-containing protein [Gordonia sp. N1V]MDF3280874.1 SPFH domain-containing protein [Gordonia sp. N1V]
MSGSFITAIVFAVLAILAVIAVPFGRAEKVDDSAPMSSRALAISVAVVLWLVVAIILLAASLTVVSTRNIGVVTTFGRPTGHIGNGLHFVAPWSSVTELDGAIQIEQRTGKDATTVRLGNDSTATVDNTIQWRIKPDAADSLFLDYRTFDNIRDNLIDREANAALNDVLSTYNPLASVQSAQDAGGDNEKLADQVTNLLRQRVGSRVEVTSVLIPVIHFDQSTQDKLNLYNAEVANTRIAEQKQKTAAAEAQANQILSQSVNNDPNVLVSKCLDIVKANGGSPAGCWPGGAVIANGGK